MQLISTLALAASTSALVAPAAPKASTALKGATLDDQLKKIPGASPLKNAPADYGFDPLGFAKVSYPRFGLPEDDLLRTNALRAYIKEFISDEPHDITLMFESSPRPIVTWSKRLKMEASAKTSFTASMFFR